MRYFIVHLHRLLDPATDATRQALTSVLAMFSWKRHRRVQRWVQVAVGTLAAEYLRLVYARRASRSSRRTVMRASPDLRSHHMLPVIRRDVARPAFHERVRETARRSARKVLISRHRDGEINAIAAERLGIETIRGSGDIGRSFSARAALGAFQAHARRRSQDGYIVALTADVPKIARVAGRGIVKLARKSGRPIYPIALATSRRYVLNNWDTTTIHLPFGRGGRWDASSHESAVQPRRCWSASRCACRPTLTTTR